MDINELFSGEEIVKAKYRGIDTMHHLRQPTNQEMLEFRRKSANVKVRNKEIQTSDVALQAPIELYDKICTKFVIQNGGAPVEYTQGFKEKVDPELKLAVISAYQNRFEIEQQETLGN